MAAVDPIPKPRPCHRRVSDDHSRFHAPERPLIRKNVPNTKQSTTVIARLFFPIHAHKDPSIAEARAILEPLADDAGIFPERLERQERKLRARMPHEGQLDGEITGRELDVLRLLTSELSNRQIAQRRYVVAGMLRTHVKSI